MNKIQLREVILEQRQIFDRDFRIVKREIPDSAIQTKKITVISGIRRCGKSTLLRQIADMLPGYHYINFEDERLLDFRASDFNLLLEIFYERDPEVNTYFIDEIQIIDGWEKFANRLFTMGKKLFITGSNAKLLSSEIASSLTGRNRIIELFPFSFREYLDYRNFPVKEDYNTQERAGLSSHLNDYIKLGGFPEVIESKDSGDLVQLYRDILIKDLLVRLKIRDTTDFRELALYLLSNTARKMSYNNLKKILDFSSTTKVKGYVDSMMEAWLFLPLRKYNPAIKKQLMNDRKIYGIDTGLVGANAFSFSREKGRLMETVVFLELKRRGLDIYYHQDLTECDFLIRRGRDITHAIQVSYTLSNLATRQREIRGLMDCMEKYQLGSGFIITLEEEEIIEDNGAKIRILPLWKFLLHYPSISS